MKFTSTLAALSLLACSNNAQSTSSAECQFNLHNMPPCAQGDYTVTLQTERLAADEVLLQALKVSIKSKQHVLNITPDTSLLEGDVGIICFDDINFDGIADIAISTSFGLANQYMDYWVFDKKQQRFVKVGNHPRFTLHPKNKSLSNTAKIDAARYEKHMYTWQADKLVEKPTASK